jgi:hypothetical protein
MGREKEGNPIPALPLPTLFRPRAGCTEMQGYLFSAAKPAAEIRQLFFSHGRQSALDRLAV